MELPNSVNGVEGLTTLEASERKAVLSGGRFALPPGFPSEMSSMWKEEGPGVIEAQQEEVLQFAGVKAAGWTVFKHLVNNKQEPYKRSIGKTTYVLLMRPRALQQAVNQIYANQSRTITNGEVEGDSTAVNANSDPGILSNSDIKQFDRLTRDQENAGGGYLKGVGGNPDPQKAVELNLV